MIKPVNKVRLNKFGVHVKKIREDLGLSQDKVVANCDLTKSNLSMIENGNRNLSFTTFLELAKGLNKEPKDLLDLDFELKSDDIHK